MRWKTSWSMHWHRVPKSKTLTKEFGWSKTDKNYRAISYYDYALKTPADTGDSIGVVFANGAIMDGEETQGMLAVIPLRHKSATLALTRK